MTYWVPQTKNNRTVISIALNAAEPPHNRKRLFKQDSQFERRKEERYASQQGFHLKLDMAPFRSGMSLGNGWLAMLGKAAYPVLEERERLTYMSLRQDQLGSADSRQDTHSALILDQYIPYFLATIANKWTSSSSRLYLRTFGIGVVEWRVLVSLHTLGSASSLDCVNLAGLDPAAVSRAVRTMEERGLIIPEEGRFAGRTKPYTITAEGMAVYDAVRHIALKREAVLLQDLSDEERQTLLQLLRRLHLRLPDIQDDV